MTAQIGHAAVPPTYTFIVNSSADTHDVGPGDGKCNDASGHCTMRAAVEEGNSDTTGSLINIVIPAGTYTLTLGVLTPSTNRFNITGAGASSTIISGNNTSEVFDNTTILSIRGVTITKGSAGAGGGIYDGGTLTLVSDTLTLNTATGDGGAIYKSSIQPLTIYQTIISNNSASASSSSCTSGCSGAGLGGGLLDASGITNISYTTFSGNTAGTASACITACSSFGKGGAIYADESETLNNVTFSGNNAGNAPACKSACSNGGKGGVIYNVYKLPRPAPPAAPTTAMAAPSTTMAASR